MFRFARRGNIEYLEAEAFSALGFVVHAFCTRMGGVSEGPYSTLNAGFFAGDRDDDVRRNLTLVRGGFAIPEGRLIQVRQVHGDRIITIDKKGPLPTDPPEGDAMITDRPGVALGIKTADCVPLLFVDPVHRVIGAAHAGWRGTALGLAAKMIDALDERFSSRREDIIVAIGPAIGPCCYQVDLPVRESLLSSSSAVPFLRPCREEGRWMLDLALANRLQLLDKGVAGENIVSADLCTACRRDLFFSHRADRGCTGRQINFLMLADGGRQQGV